MKNIIIILFVFGLFIQSFAQVVKDEKLPEVVINISNYKYIHSVNMEDADISVELLEQKVAQYDLINSDVYVDEFSLYNVSFYIPDGYILAAYDGEGNITHTIEKFKNVKLPSAVMKSVNDKYPRWTVSNNVYRVNYSQSQGVTKIFKFTLKNGDKRIRIKTDGKGNFN